MERCFDQGEALPAWVADDGLIRCRVDPTNPIEIIGPGFAIQKAGIEASDEALTALLEGKLPWLASLGESYLKGKNSVGFPLGLSGPQFTAEEASAPWPNQRSSTRNA